MFWIIPENTPTQCLNNYVHVFFQERVYQEMIKLLTKNHMTILYKVCFILNDSLLCLYIKL